MSKFFINPVELLELGTTPLAELDGATLRKSRNRLRHQLQLSDDGLVTYHGQQLDQSAVEMACADLDDPNRLHVWHRLSGMVALNEFLGKGRVEPLLQSPAQYVHLAFDQKLIEVVGARYAEQFDRALTAAFDADDYNRLKELAELPTLFSSTDSNQAYKSVRRLLREQIQELRRQTEELDEGDDESEVSEVLDEMLGGNFHSINLGNLPNAHFAGLRTEFAMAVRNYAIKLFNTFYSVDAPLRLLEMAAAYDTDEQTVDTIAEDLEQIREIEKQQAAQAKQAAFMEQFGHLFSKLMQVSEQVEQKSPATQKITAWANGLSPSISALNTCEEDEEIAMRRSFAVGLRNLSVALWNKLEDGTTALLVLNKALTIKAGASILAQLQQAKKDLTEAAEAKAISVRVNNALEQVASWIKQTERGVPAEHIKTWILSLIDTIQWLNSKGAAMAEARQALALALRVLAVAYWNNLNDGETAKFVVGLGLSLQLDNATKANLQKVAADLTEAMRPKGLFGWIKKMLNCLVPILLVSGLASCESSSSTNVNEAVGNEAVAEQALIKSDSATYEPPASPYAGNHLVNGSSPLNNCFGKGKYGGPCWVRFDNSANSTDAIMCLINTHTGRTIRNEYIRAGTIFKMSRVPRGTYYIKGFYGNDWNPTRRSACGTAGYFDSNQQFSASPDDTFEMVSNGRGFSTNTITLYGVENGNMAQQPLSAEQFFQQ